MRSELREYGYDWLLGSTLKYGGKILEATEKELAAAYELVPHFKEPMQILRRLGDSARILMETNAKWMDDVISAHDRGNKVVLTTYCYPVGILRAFNCVPLNMEVFTAYGGLMWKRGVFDFLDYCVEAGMTETACSGQRGAMGAYLAGIGARPDFCLCNTAGICDSNANAFHFYTSYMDIPMYMHDSPSNLTSERSREYHRQDFRRMLVFLEEQTGKKLDYDYLREIAKEIQLQDELINEIQSLMTCVPSPVPSMVPAVIYLLKFSFNGMPEATRVLREILRVCRGIYSQGIAGTPSGRESARILTAYIDHYTPNFKFFQLFDRFDISVTGCMLSYYWNSGAPYAKGREDETYIIDLTDENSIIDSLSDQLARMPMIKQIRGPYDAPTQWLEDTLSAARVYQVKGTIYVGTLGCRNTWGMVKPFARDMEAAGFPTLILFADAFDDRITSWEACKNRIIEFLKVRNIL
jgi:hypothetical protein